MATVFETLNAKNVNEHTEKKNNLTYLSWAWAWAEVKKAYPNATYKIYEDFNGCFYHTDGKTCWVKTGVTIEDIEMIEYLPVMNYKNISIPLENVTSTDVNKAIQRSLTKACARHGLGLYIYAGEDLPEKVYDEKELAEMEENMNKGADDFNKQFASTIDDKKVVEVEKAIKKLNLTIDDVKKTFNVKSLKDLTPEKAEIIINKVKK